jgi:ABC-type phosphate transport system permease subunit
MGIVPRDSCNPQLPGCHPDTGIAHASHYVLVVVIVIIAIVVAISVLAAIYGHRRRKRRAQMFNAANPTVPDPNKWPG